MCAKPRTAAASNNRDHARNLSLRTLVVAFNRSHVNIGRATTSQSLLLLLACDTYSILWCYALPTSRSWWFTQPTQRHRRGRNTGLGNNVLTTSDHKVKRSFFHDFFPETISCVYPNNRNASEHQVNSIMAKVRSFAFCH